VVLYQNVLRQGRVLKRKPLHILLGLAAIGLLLIVAIWAALQSAFAVNRLAALLEPVTGYRVSVEHVRISPALHAQVSGLKVVATSGKGPDMYVVRAEVDAAIKNVVQAEVERLVLTGPKLFFRLDAGNEKTDLSALEQLPPVKLLVVEDGEVEVVYQNGRAKLTNLKADVKDFSAQKGGNARFESLLEVSTEGEQTLKGRGRCKGNLDASGPIRNPEGKGAVNLSLDTGVIGPASVTKFLFGASVRLAKNLLTFDEMTLSVGKASVKAGEKNVALDGFSISTDLSFNLDSTALVMKSIKGKAPGLGPFSARFEGTLKGEMPWKGAVEAPSVDFSQTFSALKPFLPDEYKGWAIQGAGALQADAEGLLGNYDVWRADVKLDFREGGFKSADASKAGQRISGNVTLKLRSGPQDKKARFDLAAEAGDGEFLWGKYYRDFKGEWLKGASQGTWTTAPELSFESKGTFDLFDTGTYSYSARQEGNELVLRMHAEKLSHTRLFAILLKEYLREIVPMASTVEVLGMSDLDAEMTLRDGTVSCKGRLVSKETSLAVPEVKLSASGVDLMLPFDFRYPGPTEPVTALKPEEAVLSINRFEKGSVLVEGMRIPFILSGNRIELLAKLDAPLYGGRVSLARLTGVNLLTPQMRIDLALSVDGVDVGRLTEETVGARVEGMVNVDFQRITFREGRWSTTGNIVASVFGGRVIVTSIFGENLFSSARRVGGNIAFRDINLEEVTRKIELGRMTGHVNGSLTHLILEYGEPARFRFEVESDPTKGVSQMISVDAIESLSILGTGSSGISAVLNSGVNKFFKEYPYSKMGIICTLENDTFQIRGKIHEGGTEYLVRRGWLRGLDVVIQNPDNTISFRDMQERIGRIFRPKQETKTVL
jgi:hypothetical protein